jgi:hypothetical protein
MIIALINAGFNRIGVNARFLHVAIGRKDGGRNDDDVIWLY